MKRLDHRIERSKRNGKIALGAVIVLSLVFAAVLVPGLTLALEEGRPELVRRAVFGLALLGALDVFSIVLIRRQHLMLDEARDELEEMVRLDRPEIRGS